MTNMHEMIALEEENEMEGIEAALNCALDKIKTYRRSSASRHAEYHAIEHTMVSPLRHIKENLAQGKYGDENGELCEKALWYAEISLRNLRRNPAPGDERRIQALQEGIAKLKNLRDTLQAYPTGLYSEEQDMFSNLGESQPFGGMTFDLPFGQQGNEGPNFMTQHAPLFASGTKDKDEKGESVNLFQEGEKKHRSQKIRMGYDQLSQLDDEEKEPVSDSSETFVGQKRKESQNQNDSFSEESADKFSAAFHRCFG